MFQAKPYAIEAFFFGVEVLDLSTEARFGHNTPIISNGSGFDESGVLVGKVDCLIRVLPLLLEDRSTIGIKTLGNGNSWKRSAWYLLRGEEGLLPLQPFSLALSKMY